MFPKFIRTPRFEGVNEGGNLPDGSREERAKEKNRRDKPLQAAMYL